jgi:HEAT repeat protein
MALWAVNTLDKEGAHADVIVQAVKDKESSVRLTAIGILREYGSKNPGTALPPLLAAAKQKEDGGMRESALEGLGYFKLDPAVVLPILRSALDSDTWQVEFAAIRVAPKLGPAGKDLVGSLIELLKKSDNNAEKLEIVQALGEIGPAAKEAIPALTKALGRSQQAGGSPPLNDAVSNAIKKINK